MTGTKTKKKDFKKQKTGTDAKQTISQAQKKSIKSTRASTTATSSRASTLAPSMAPKTSSQAPSRRATVEVSDDDDDEQGSNGGTLDKDGDVIMEPVLGSQDDEEDEEDDESELRMSMLLLVLFVADCFAGRLTKEWTAPIYAFFLPTPVIEYIQGRRCHAFQCAAKSCQHSVRRFLDTGDAKSTGNMQKHAKKCWSAEVIASADKAKNANEVRLTTVKGSLDPQTIMAAFERTGKGKVKFSHRQHTKTESRAEIVRWVAESKRPFSIVSDRGFQSLMKTGRPEYYIPSPVTVSRDVKMVFANTRKRIAKMLQEHDGALNFATDGWTSPNHKAYVAITIHFEHDGKPISMVLDLVEVAMSHSGVNLAAAFAQVLDEFGISSKVIQQSFN